MSRDRPHWWPAYIGIGSNLESPVDQVQRAFDDLAELPDTVLTLRSNLYRSAAVGPGEQPDYVNAAAALVTRLTSRDLLLRLHAIEAARGRKRDTGHWGPRCLDLDLLVYDSETSADSALRLPHPRIAERNFVLWPLNDIAPHLTVPGLASVAELASRVSPARPRIELINR